MSKDSIDANFDFARQMPTNILSRSTAVDDGGRVFVLDAARVASASLNCFDNALGLRIVLVDLAKDDVLAIKPTSHDGGDEELRAVGIGTSIGHRQQEWSGVLFFEVLVGKLLTINGLAASSIATSKVTTLEHELGDHTMEL